MQKKGFIISCIALAISLITLVIVFWKAAPYSVVDLGTFIGVVAAFIGISVTLLIGYQIYNAIEIQEKISVIDKLEKELIQVKDVLENSRNEQNEDSLILQARISQNSNIDQLDAFIKFHKAIMFALSVDHKDLGYDWMLDEIETFMIKIEHSCFVSLSSSNNTETIKMEIEKFQKEYIYDSQAIKSHPNYYIIRRQYELLMTAFENRLEKIKNGNATSRYKID